MKARNPDLSVSTNLQRTMGHLKGVILVGGPSVGTRFRPLSMDIPKPLFPIAGVPMVHHHVSALAKLKDMKEIIILGFFEQGVLDRFLLEVQIEFSHINIRYSNSEIVIGEINVNKVLICP